MSRFDSLAQIQEDLLADDPETPIRIFGINGIDYASGNPYVAVLNRSLPWLQDERDVDVWKSWEVDYRDVVIVDRQNRRAAVFNLTDHNLNDPVNGPAEVAALRSLLLEVAAAGN